MGLISEDIISEVLERTDIVSTISGYIPLKKAGRNFKANCPFHNEKTPSFVVNPDKQIFHCFGCGAGGNAVTFVMKQERLEFPEAIQRLAQKVGVTIQSYESGNSKTKDLREALYRVQDLAAQFFHRNLMTQKEPSVKKAREYLKKRDVSLEIVKKFQLGFAPDQWESLLSFLKKNDISLTLVEKAGLIIKRENQDGYYDRFRNRITFPIFDKRSRCVAFGARALKNDELAKYINSPETPIYTKGDHLYGFHMAKDAVAQKDFVIVVEGYMDFIMPFQAGIENTVASLGTALTLEQIRLIRRYTHNVVMLFDTDKAGESAMIRSLDLLIEEGMTVKVATLKDEEDPDSFIRKFGREKFDERIDQAQTLVDYKLEVLKGQYDPSTIEGRAKISSEMLPTINKFDNEILKSEYLRRLAQTLFISEEALLKESKKLITSAMRHIQDVVSQPVSTNEKPRVVERNILRLMLEDEELISLTKEETELSDFKSSNIRSLIEKIYELFEDGKEVNTINLMSCFSDEGVVKIISSLSMNDGVFSGDTKKMHRDCVDRMIDDRFKNQRRDLLEKIRLAENSGDHKELEQLKEKFNKLVKSKP